MIVRKVITSASKLHVLKSHGAIVLCQACSEPKYIGDIEYDHWLALVDGGPDTAENLRPLCSKCHRRKSAREHIENSKTKRLQKAREVHGQVVARVTKRPPGKIKPRPFPKQQRGFR